MSTIKSVILAKFGGPTKIAGILGITCGAVSQWGDDIPARHWATLLNAAPDLNVELKPDEFYIPLNHTPPPNPLNGVTQGKSDA